MKCEPEALRAAVYLQCAETEEDAQHSSECKEETACFSMSTINNGRYIENIFIKFILIHLSLDFMLRVSCSDIDLF